MISRLLGRLAPKPNDFQGYMLEESSKIIYGDVELFSRSLRDQILPLVDNLKGKSDSQIFLSSEFAELKKIASSNPESTYSILKELSSKNAEYKRIVRSLFKRFAHSKNETLREFAFGEL